MFNAMTSICLICHKEYKIKPYLKGKTKYCSRLCRNISDKGKPTWNKGKKNPFTLETIKKMSRSATGRLHSNETKSKLSKISSGRKHTEETKLKISLMKRNENNWNWKGDKVGYIALHQWVYKNLPISYKCEHCGTTKSSGYEWANKSHEYKRDLEDWIRLCISCHRKYDNAYRRNKNL